MLLVRKRLKGKFLDFGWKSLFSLLQVKCEHHILQLLRSLKVLKCKTKIVTTLIPKRKYNDFQLIYSFKCHYPKLKQALEHIQMQQSMKAEPRFFFSSLLASLPVCVFYQREIPGTCCKGFSTSCDPLSFLSCARHAPACDCSSLLSSLFMVTFCSDGPDNELQWSYNCFAAGSVRKLQAVNFPTSAH